MRTTVLKPGLLVSLHTSLRGGVNYQRVELEADHTTAEGERRARWETTRHIPDPAEFEAASKARSAARAKVAGACCFSAFGLLCPTEREAELQAAIAEARAIADAHNGAAQLSRVEVYVMIGRVAQDDVEAARAISSEMRELIEAMQQGIRQADPAAIREAANRARSVGGMLTEETATKVDAAIAQARKVARELVKRVEKAGEVAATVVAQCNVGAIEAARFAFLDMDEGRVEGQAAAARPVELDGAAPLQAAAQPALALEVS